MNLETEFILQCNRNSFIDQVLFAKEPFFASVLQNQPFLFYLTPEYLEAGKQFLEDVRWTGKAVELELELLLDMAKYRFSFSGIRIRDSLIIIAQHAAPELTPEVPLEEMVSEEVEATLTATQQYPEPENHSEVTVWDLMEEMSRLNNELINTKRELVRKNVELERLQQQLKKG